MKSLYIHIPFCDQICSYCDFPKVFTQSQNTDEYLDALIVELEIYRESVDFSSLQTVYLGGGTPTALSVGQLEKLFNYLKSFICFDRLTEVSIEANPDSINDDEKIACLKRHGVTRVSLGVQTFNPDHLKILQRTHTQDCVREVVTKLSTLDFEINVDMIYSIPTQTLADWEADLDVLLTLPITHVSAYSLILEQNTKFFIDYERDELDLIDNEVEAKMFESAIERLKEAGFDHYEISNFAKGVRSHHNLTYWENESYLGVGLGSHGKVDQIRYDNTRSITKYKKTLFAGELPILSKKEQRLEEQIEESMFLGMRLLAGINLAGMSARYGVDILDLYSQKIAKLVELGYVSLLDGVLRLTQKGLLMANDVFEEFLLLD